MGTAEGWVLVNSMIKHVLQNVHQSSKKELGTAEGGVLANSVIKHVLLDLFEMLLRMKEDGGGVYTGEMENMIHKWTVN